MKHFYLLETFNQKDSLDKIRLLSGIFLTRSVFATDYRFGINYYTEFNSV